jgi:hypothetical protein
MAVFGATDLIAGRPCAACLNYLNKTPGCLRTAEGKFVHMVAPGVYVSAAELPPGRRDLCAACQNDWETENARIT